MNGFNKNKSFGRCGFILGDDRAFLELREWFSSGGMPLSVVLYNEMERDRFGRIHTVRFVPYFNFTNAA